MWPGAVALDGAKVTADETQALGDHLALLTWPWTPVLSLQYLWPPYCRFPGGLLRAEENPAALCS